MTGAAQSGAAELPATLSWYRDAANWIVGLSTAALAAGLTYRDEIRTASLLPRAFFFVSAFAFFLALVAGIQFYFWLTAYGNQRERRDALAAGSQPQGPAEEQMRRATKLYGRWYRILLWAFHFGIVGYAVSTIWLLGKSEGAGAPEPSWSLSVVPCCNDCCPKGQAQILKIEQHTGEIWYLAADSTGPATWRQMRIDSSAH